MAGYFFSDGIYELTNNCNACGDDLRRHPTIDRVDSYHAKCPTCGELMEIIREQDRVALRKWFKKTNASFLLVGAKKYETI